MAWMKTAFQNVKHLPSKNFKTGNKECYNK